jgi:hypothetical protein
MSLRYDGDRMDIRQGLTHFVMGKVVLALVGMFTLLLVIREFIVGSFAAYSVLVALVDMLTTISGFGLTYVLLCYVSELFFRHYQRLLRIYVYSLIGLLRPGVLLPAVLLVANVYAEELASQIGLVTLAVFRDKN